MVDVEYGIASKKRVRIVIVGGGFCGVAVAWHLRQQMPPSVALELSIVERCPPVGRGIAYAKADSHFLLNTPVEEMSLDAAQPTHFLDWLRQQGDAVTPDSFVARDRYGEYLEAALREGWGGPSLQSGLSIIAKEAVSFLPQGRQYALRLQDGQCLDADHVVFATGLMPPSERAFALNVPMDGSWLCRHPWASASRAPLPRGSESLVLGTGLTAVDVALALLERAGADRVHMVSRRGTLPLLWQPPAPTLPSLPEPWPASVSRWLHWARRQRLEGADGASIVAALRPWMPAIWRSLSWVERRRFLRHAKGHWEAARQRLPPPTAARLASALCAGKIVVHQARVKEWEDHGAEAVATLVDKEGHRARLAVARVVLCTGPEGNYRRIRHPLVQSLLGTGLARVDPLGLGLDVTSIGQLRDEDGAVSPGLWAIGSLTKGAFWESTAVPELRARAAELAMGLSRAIVSS